MEDDRCDGVSGIAPVLALLALATLMLGGWWLFPQFFAYMARQDCVATGRVSCGD